MSTHNLCFGAKIRKIYPYKPQFYYIEVRCKGVYITRTCLHDVHHKKTSLSLFQPSKTQDAAEEIRCVFDDN